MFFTNITQAQSPRGCQIECGCYSALPCRDVCDVRRNPTLQSGVDDDFSVAIRDVFESHFFEVEYGRVWMGTRTLRHVSHRADVSVRSEVEGRRRCQERGVAARFS